MGKIERDGEKRYRWETDKVIKIKGKKEQLKNV